MSGGKAKKMGKPFDEPDVVSRLGSEAGLSEVEARGYLALLRDGSIPAEPPREEMTRLIRRGMAIFSGDGHSVVPVHPRLGIANFYRTWRENAVREINERRIRVDKLIIELIPMYEAATEKRIAGRGK
jgi:predicted nuclease with RNAse H fold